MPRVLTPSGLIKSPVLPVLGALIVIQLIGKACPFCFYPYIGLECEEKVTIAYIVTLGSTSGNFPISISYLS